MTFIIRTHVIDVAYLKKSGMKIVEVLCLLVEKWMRLINVSLDSLSFYRFPYMLNETQSFLSRIFEMKDLGEASFVLGNEIILKIGYTTFSNLAKSRRIQKFSRLEKKSLIPSLELQGTYFRPK